jgi:hypothetical protein
MGALTSWFMSIKRPVSADADAEKVTNNAKKVVGKSISCSLFIPKPSLKAGFTMSY